MLTPARERLLLATLAAVQFTHIMDFMVMMPLGPRLMRVFQIEAPAFGLLVSAYTFAAGFAGLVGSFFIDRFSRRRALLFIYTGFGLGTLACALAPGYETLLLMRVLTGLFGGLIGALVLAIVGDAIPFERRGRAMGVVMLAFSAASVVGVPGGLYFANLYEWHAPFYMLAGLSATVLAMCYASVPALAGHLQETPTSAASSGATASRFRVLVGIRDDGNQQRALLLMFLMMVGHFAIIPYIAPYMVHNVGITEEQILWIYMIGGASTIVSSPIVGRLADRLGKARVFVIFVLFTFVPIFLITNLPPSSLQTVLVATTMFFIASSGRMIPAMALISSAAPPATRGGFLAVQSAVQQIGSGSAAFIGGLIIATGANGQLAYYEWIGYLAMVSGLLCVALVRFVRPVEDAADS